MEFAGEFETHLTVRLNDSPGIEALQQWAAQHSLKCVHIVLSRGIAASQPMLTRQGTGLLTGEIETASLLRQELEAEGFPVTRIKVEAAPWNQDVPQFRDEAAKQPEERYFEHHIKLLLESDADLSQLGQIADRHTAHLSRNALRARNDGRYERFVSQRCHFVGREEARQQLQALLDEINAAGYAVMEFEEEFVVHDSNLALDDGWIMSAGQ